MDTIAEKLDSKLRDWAPEMAEHVRRLVGEIITLADQDALDIARSRRVEQEVLELIDAPPSR